MNRLITTSEAAGLLSVSPRTVLKWIERDAIPYVALPNAGGSRREYRIPLYGLLNSLSGTYDIGSQLETLSAAAASGVREGDLRAAQARVDQETETDRAVAAQAAPHA